MGFKIYFEKFGSPKVLEEGDGGLPEPAAGEVQVQNRAIGVNPVDWKVVAGYLQDWAPVDFPAVPGNESAGVVVAVGKDVTDFAVGDQVIWSGFTGGYQQSFNVPASQLTSKPASVDFEQAALLPVAAGTAYSALRQIGVGEGDTVLVHAAAGGVGSAAVQIAKALGAKVIGTASEANHEYLRSLGAEPVAYGSGLVDRIRAVGEITASVDAVGGAESAAATAELLADRSRAVTAVADEHTAAAGIAGVERAPDYVESTAKLAAEGKLSFVIAERIPLSDAAKALEISYGGHVRGKLVLVP